jgi:hypothetical protein
VLNNLHTDVLKFIFTCDTAIPLFSVSEQRCGTSVYRGVTGGIEKVKKEFVEEYEY